jgi:hypothetical protein
METDDEEILKRLNDAGLIQPSAHGKYRLFPAVREFFEFLAKECEGNRVDLNYYFELRTAAWAEDAQ